MMGLVYPWICIQTGIDHDPVDEVIHHAGDAVHAAEPIALTARRGAKTKIWTTLNNVSALR